MFEETKEKLQSGATRSKMDVRWDLIPAAALRQVAEVFEVGARQHGDRNWEKGMPAMVCYNHAQDHLHAWMAGDKGCNHLAHACTNLLMMIHSLDNEDWKELNNDCPSGTRSQL